jgi:hypothetical protein
MRTNKLRKSKNVQNAPQESNWAYKEDRETAPVPDRLNQRSRDETRDISKAYQKAVGDKKVGVQRKMSTEETLQDIRKRFSTRKF